jgi:hypothetical protein
MPAAPRGEWSTESPLRHQKLSVLISLRELAIQMASGTAGSRSMKLGSGATKWPGRGHTRSWIRGASDFDEA